LAAPVGRVGGLAEVVDVCLAFLRVHQVLDRLEGLRPALAYTLYTKKHTR
jgi:hypothetical protein